MWARRCGVPAKWPSRIKVFLMSLINAVVGLALYKFMNGADVGYLDLQTPVESEIVCLTNWPERGAFTKIFDFDGWHNWLMVKSDINVYRMNNACMAPSVLNATCEQVDVPLNDMKRKLAISMSRSQPNTSDQLVIYATLFLVLAACLWSAINTHDLTLLSSAKKDLILDLDGIVHTYRSIRFAFRILGFQLWPVVFGCFSRSQVLLGIVGSIFILPIQLVWSAIAFTLISSPVIAVIFICHPLRTNRLWVFSLCICFAIFGLVLLFTSLAFVAGRASRPQFAVTWNAAHGQDLCVCGCSFQVSDSVCMDMLFIGLGVAIQSTFIAVRCLKGLRRSNWANLLTVTFSIPLTAYSVEWTEPDGKPIKNRKEGEAVQSELAFDPFALMDEQPNSASTTVTLQPVLVPQIKQGTRSLEGPMIPKSLQAAAMLEDASQMEYIGCCGFPCRTGGMQVRLQITEESDDRQAETPVTAQLQLIQDGSVHDGGQESLCSQPAAAEQQIDRRDEDTGQEHEPAHKPAGELACGDDTARHKEEQHSDRDDQDPELGDIQHI